MRVDPKIITKAKKFALQEINKYSSPNLTQFKIANQTGQKLARKHHADPDTVLLGTILMDCKIGQALIENRLSDHIQMSADAAQKILSGKNKLAQKVIPCILSHHKTTPFQSLEAEVVANADCYRFLTIKGFLSFIHQLGAQGINFSDAINYTNQKADEKWGIITLPDVKKELSPNYKLIKRLIREISK